ncbi:MAG: amidohydrolase family protein, partial [Oscillospiraceae bacterium]|nr:amidohydrolase family protein [Oscillospiraceae bacterium]
MLFKNIKYVDEDFSVRCGDVSVKGEKIAKIGNGIEPEGEVYDGKNKLLIPGLVNTHCHAAMTLMRGYGDGLDLEEWLFTKIFPFEDKMDDEAAYAGTLLGIAEMLAGGVTSFTDSYMFPEGVCRAILESGIKCNYGRPVSDFYDGELEDLRRFREGLLTKEKYDGANGGRLRIETDLHAVYTSSDNVMRRLANYIKMSDNN